VRRLAVIDMPTVAQRFTSFGPPDAWYAWRAHRSDQRRSRFDDRGRRWLREGGGTPQDQIDVGFEIGIW